MEPSDEESAKAAADKVNEQPTVPARLRHCKEGDAPVTDQNFAISRVEDLVVAPLFSELFPVSGVLVDKIAQSMRSTGYDTNWPIAVWGHTVVDGHTRLRAAQDAGIDTVPIVRHEFVTEDAAVEYAVTCQVSRRNLSDAEIAVCVSKLDSIRARGGNHEAKAQRCAIAGPNEKSAAITAKTLGTSTRKVEQTRTILKHGDQETQKAVLKSEKSINAAYRETQAERHADKAESSVAADVGKAGLSTAEASGAGETQIPLSQEIIDWAKTAWFASATRGPVESWPSFAEGLRQTAAILDAKFAQADVAYPIDKVLNEYSQNFVVKVDPDSTLAASA